MCSLGSPPSLGIKDDLVSETIFTKISKHKPTQNKSMEEMNMTLSYHEYGNLRDIYRSTSYAGRMISPDRMEALAHILVGPDNRDDARNIFAIDEETIQAGLTAITRRLEQGLETRIAEQGRLDECQRELDRQRGSTNLSRL